MASTDVDIKQLLEAGAHFGHKTERWHPKMAPYIHSKRGGTHIIDLTKTVDSLEVALAFLSKTASEGKQILLVGTKRQAQEKVKQVAIATGMPYVTERWLGGMLTNWNTIGGRVKHLQELENRMASGELANKYNKLEVQRFQEEIDQMNIIYGGIKELNKKPGAVFHRRHRPRCQRLPRSHQAGSADCGASRHQCRSQRGAIPDSVQRRRHQNHRADARLRSAGHRGRQGQGQSRAGRR